MQEDRGREYTNARRVAKEYEVVTKGLNRNAASVPPNSSPDEVKQVRLSLPPSRGYVISLDFMIRRSRFSWRIGCEYSRLGQNTATRELKTIGSTSNEVTNIIFALL